MENQDLSEKENELIQRKRAQLLLNAMKKVEDREKTENECKEEEERRKKEKVQLEKIKMLLNAMEKEHKENAEKGQLRFQFKPNDEDIKKTGK